MAYPTLPIDQRESHRVLRDGRQEDTTGDGSTRVRKLHADKYDFEIKHPQLTSAQMTTLESFYSSNSAVPAFDFVWPEDGVTYSVRFGAGAIRTQWVSAVARHAWIRLVGV